MLKQVQHELDSIKTQSVNTPTKPHRRLELLARAFGTCKTRDSGSAQKYMHQRDKCDNEQLNNVTARSVITRE